MRQAAEEATGSLALVGRGRVLSRSARWRLGRGPVSGSSSASVIDSGLAIPRRLSLELLVKGENGSLGAAVNVACSAATRDELGAGLRELGAKEGGGAVGVERIGGERCSEGVACAATTGVHVGADVWVRFGDLVGRHFQ